MKVCGAPVAGGSSCRHPIGTAGRCAAGHPSKALQAATQAGHPLAHARALRAAQAAAIDAAAPSPAVQLAQQVAGRRPPLDVATGGALVPLRAKVLGATPVGTVSHANLADARELFHAGRHPNRPIDSRTERLFAAATACATSSTGVAGEALRAGPPAEDGSVTVPVRCGRATVRIRCLETGRWPNRQMATRLEPQVLVGAATRVDSPQFAAGHVGLTDVVYAAAAVRGRHGDDVDGRTLPPEVARRFLRPAPLEV